MSDDTISIKRYPNRRYYARNARKYVSLNDIEQMVQTGHTVEIRDSQTGNDLTRVVLTQIIMDRHPEKLSLFPTALLHSILRSNDVMSGFLRDYFRHSLAYLEYLQQHTPATTTLAQPMHWVKAWLDGIGSRPPDTESSDASSEPAKLRERVEQLEQRLSQLEPPDEP